MPFNQRPIGTTSISVSTLGFGSASLAGNITEVSDEDARGAINRAIDVGITYFDTAPFYGYGRAERLVGDVLRPHREGKVLSTKAGRLLARFFGPRPATEKWQNPPPFVDVFDYSYDAIMRSVEDSYQRLGLNSIEIVYVHDIGTYTHGDANTAHFKDLADGGYRALEQLRASGDIKAIGLGTNEWQVMMDAFEIGEWDVFLLAGRYTLLEQTALSPFLDTCIKKNASVVIGGPFNSGILVGGTTWDYASAPPHIVDKVEKLEKTCAEFNVPLPAAALQFPLRHPAVASVIPGPRSVTEFDQILDWWKIDIKPELWAALKDQSLLDDDAPI